MCKGEDAFLPWVYSLPNNTLQGLFITRDAATIQTIVIKEGTDPIKYYGGRAKLNENEGLTIYKVAPADAGTYEYGLLYNNNKFQSEGQLSVISKFGVTHRFIINYWI